MRTFSDDASLIVTLLRQVADSYNEASIYRPLLALSELNPDRRGKLIAYARDQFSRGRGILWTSQLHGLNRLLRDSSFALCTPTGSGKTLIANMALIKELLLHVHDGPAPLAMYLVPSRALAGEVEAKLHNELGSEIAVTGLYGGADWGITDYWLSGEEPTVLIVTVEKADALTRYLGPLLTERLRLLIIDEAHQVVPEDGENTRISFSDHNNRSIRMESFVSRILVQRPDIVRIALTAVAGGASRPVARWIEGRAEAKAVGVHYRSTRQVIGILETAPNLPSRILLDMMNGRPLYIRGQEEPVFLDLRVQSMPRLPSAMRNSLNRFNSLAVLWTALHLAEENQRILISVAQEPEQTMRWFKEALELPSWAGAPAFALPEGELRERFDEARAACVDYCGEDCFELALLDRGIATSHGQMPQRLRRLMTEMIDRRICPIAVATATLTEGVNLPFDLIFLTSLKRRAWNAELEQPVISPLSTAEFRNLAGRAGRPGAARGIEGMTLVAIPARISTTANSFSATQRNQLEELSNDYYGLREKLLIEEVDADKVESPLALLIAAIREKAIQLLGVPPDQFLTWLEQVTPIDISDEAGKGATSPHARFADSLDELDGILLTACEEIARMDELEMTGPAAEEQLAALWQTTFTAVAAVQEDWMERAFVRRGRAIVETVYPDAEERRRLYEYGFSPFVGRRFEIVALRVRALVAAAQTYGTDDPETRLDVFEQIGDLLSADRGFGFRVRSTISDQRLLGRWKEVLAWWMQEPDASAPDADELRGWQRFVADNLEFRLGVAIGAVVAQAWSAGAADTRAVPSLAEWKKTTGLPWFGFWARELLRWGTHDPFVAFALSRGLAKTREAAAERRGEFEAWLDEEYDDLEAENLIDPQLFIQWQSSFLQPERAATASPSESVDLTGTDGRRKRYNVIPATDGVLVRWLDPAGFELARSEDIPEEFRDKSIRNDYELRKNRHRSSVYRTFSAPIRR
ncbi:DEAD/DEAH box helicase [Skermanella mucosa]|uniref:DEAD/DEAH box helicase n=1 Tax=Skermanella mucosa TaxID=1789672 RepID=UPI001E3F3DC8|nr:DEAD/DEAH box helicase [Skermanella mucosa]UEM19535.1 DEAD/DEAH box helicase [Skermanella mucosa]